VRKLTRHHSIDDSHNSRVSQRTYMTVSDERKSVFLSKYGSHLPRTGSKWESSNDLKACFILDDDRIGNLMNSHCISVRRLIFYVSVMISLVSEFYQMYAVRCVTVHATSDCDNHSEVRASHP